MTLPSQAEEYVLRDLPRCGVYFVRYGEFVKIGSSVDVHRRLNDLQQGFPTPLEPLGFIRVGVLESQTCLETQIHHQFKTLRHRGEWFRDDPILRAFIAESAQGWPV